MLGQIVDSNSAWIGEQLAASGIDSYEHRVIGDNQTRIVEALRDLLSRSDSVLICGGIGPTQDDLTRDAIAELMGVPLVRHMDLAENIATMFRSRLRDMPQNNLRQADIPDGGESMTNPLGTAPGLRCPVGDGKYVYAVPGVPYEMQEMVHYPCDPRSAAALGRGRGDRLALAEDVGDVGVGARRERRAPARCARSCGQPHDRVPRTRYRRSRRPHHREGRDRRTAAQAIVADEEQEIRAILGDLVFGVDDETMEHAVLTQLHERGWTLGVAESVTGGLIGARIANVAGASETFRGTIGAYATDVKRSILGVTAELVVSEECAAQMAEGARRVLDADVGIAVTGVAGPAEQDGVAVGTVCFGIALPDGKVETVSTRLPGDRERVRQFSTISLLNLLRQRLDALP